MASVADSNADSTEPSVDPVASAAEDEKQTSIEEGALDFYARRTLSTVNCTAGRSSFVAGLTYYELGRFGFFGHGERASANYGRAVAAAFMFAVLSVSTSSLFSAKLTKLCMHAAQRGFVFGGVSISRLAYRFYNYTYYCLSIALMFLGFNYYPTSCGSSASTCQKAEQAAAERNSTVECTDDTIREAGCDFSMYRWIPLAFGILMLLLILLMPRRLNEIWRRSGGEKVNEHGEMEQSKRFSPKNMRESNPQDTSAEASCRRTARARTSLDNTSYYRLGRSFAGRTQRVRRQGVRLARQPVSVLR